MRCSDIHGKLLIMSKNNWPLVYVSAGAILVLIIFTAVGAYFYWQLRGEKVNLEQAQQALQRELAQLKEGLATTTLALQAEQKRNADFSAQINGLAGTVGVLDKLSKTDRELLKKYSKVYFLNEHYVPSNLATITPEYLYYPNQTLFIHANVWPKLEALLKSASSSGANLQINSAYRSYGTQAAIKSSYKITYGSGANKFSADQGYSEHQLGTTVDFGTPSIRGDFSKFGGTKEFEWLVNNAYKFGFILSYPKNNDYYVYEPWHWRYVGVALATRLHEEDKYFYGFSQRIIDSYLVNIFD